MRGLSITVGLMLVLVLAAHSANGQETPRAAQHRQNPLRTRPSAPTAGGSSRPISESYKRTATVKQVAYQEPANVEVPETKLYFGSSDAAVVVPRFHPGCCDVWPCLWGRAEYLQWWTKGMDTPPLATTSPAGTPQDDAGVLGTPGTSVLFGGTGIADGARSGGRFTVGMWLDPCQTNTFMATYLGLTEETDGLSAGSDQFSVLARPFFNVQTGMQDARLISFPDQLEGDLSIATTVSLQSGELLFRRTEYRSACGSTDFLVGYRFAELEDSLRISDTSTAISGPALGSSLAILDEFAAANQFHGVQVGLHLIRTRNTCWSFEFLAKVAMGQTRFQGAVSGQTTATNATGNTSTTAVGLLAQDTNIGTYKDDEFSTVAELGVSLRRHLCRGLTAYAGYSYLHWSDVLRSGEQVDPSINLSQIPPGTISGPRRPEFPFEIASFWAQGLNLGLEFHY